VSSISVPGHRASDQPEAYGHDGCRDCYQEEDTEACRDCHCDPLKARINLCLIRDGVHGGGAVVRDFSDQAIHFTLREKVDAGFAVVG
jgi:hypothetical protein